MCIRPYVAAGPFISRQQNFSHAVDKLPEKSKKFIKSYWRGLIGPLSL